MRQACFSIIVLLCLVLTPSLEGRSHSSSRHQTQALKKKPQPVNHITQKRQRQAERQRSTRIVASKRLHPQRTLAAQKRQQKVTVAEKKRPIISAKSRFQLKRAALQRKKTSIPNKRVRRASVNYRYQHQRKSALIQKNQPSQSALKRNQPKQKFYQKKASINRSNSRNKLDYLSFLPFHNRENAKAGGLDQLLAKDMKGQGQTVAVIELSGEWKAIKDAMNNQNGLLSPERKASYKSNFLTPIGGPGLHPEQMNDFIRDKGNPHHGSSVSSVVLDLAPQAKVLPVSTYNTYGSSQFYDTADALTDLSKRSDVSIINMSSGYTHFNIITKRVHNKNGREEELAKCIYPPKLLNAFKTVAKAGKIVVITAGNEGKPIDIPQFLPDGQMGVKDLVGHLMQELDPETRKSIIVAGSYHPDTRKITSYSNKPGSLKNAQDSFLLAPGTHVTSYNDDVAVGTSFAAPYICAAIANLTSNRKFSPKRAVQALKDTAERRPDVGTYGRGIIRADKALELLERSGGG